MAKITIEINGKTVEVEAHPKDFSTGTHGFYFRDRIKMGDDSYHCQVTISKK